MFRLHQSTYQAQVMLYHYRNVDRPICSFHPYYGKDSKPWPSKAPDPSVDFGGPEGASARLSEGKHKIAVMSMMDMGFGPYDIMTRVCSNRIKYASRHGYDFVDMSKRLSKYDVDGEVKWTFLRGADDKENDKRRPKPAAWYKLVAIAELLETYDFVFFADSDSVLMTPDVPLSKFIDLAPGADIMLTEDAHGLNSGMMIVRSSTWSKNFLKTAFDQSDFSRQRRSEDGIPYPFEYEQRAFHYLWGTDFWLDRGLPRYPHVKEVRKHFALFSQCSFNSYILHPLTPDMEKWRTATYKKGDFAVHMAGYKGSVKMGLLDNFLPKAGPDETYANTCGRFMMEPG